MLVYGELFPPDIVVIFKNNPLLYEKRNMLATLALGAI
jgi:hypothetical protein